MWSLALDSNPVGIGFGGIAIQLTLSNLAIISKAFILMTATLLER